MTLRWLVKSRWLRILYLVAGGLPALYLALLAFMYLVPSIGTLVQGAPANPEFVLSYVVWPGMGLAAVISGWLCFFTVGTSSSRGRLFHTVLISAGMVSALLLAWGMRSSGAPGIAVAPAVVGACLLFHLWRSAAQPAVPGDGPRAARSARA